MRASCKTPRTSRNNEVRTCLRTPLQSTSEQHGRATLQLGCEGKALRPIRPAPHGFVSTKLGAANPQITSRVTRIAVAWIRANATWATRFRHGAQAGIRRPRGIFDCRGRSPPTAAYAAIDFVAGDAGDGSLGQLAEELRLVVLTQDPPVQHCPNEHRARSHRLAAPRRPTEAATDQASGMGEFPSRLPEQPISTQ